MLLTELFVEGVVVHTGGTVCLGKHSVGLRQGSAATVCSRACFAAEDRTFSPLRSLQSVWVSCCSCPCFQKGEWRHGLEGTCLPLQVELGGVIPLPTYSVETSLHNSDF